HPAEIARGLALADRLRLVARAEEAGHLRGVLDQVVDVVGQLELGQHVAGHELALDLDLLAALDLGHGLGWHLDRLDRLREPEPLGFGDDRIADLVLEAGVGVDDVPAGCHAISFSRKRFRVRRQSCCSSQRTTVLNTESTPRKNSARIVTMMATKIAVREVSGQVGQTTLLPSARTWRMNSPGLVLAMSLVLLEKRIPDAFRHRPIAAPARVREGQAGSDVGSRRGFSDPSRRWQVAWRKHPAVVNPPLPSPSMGEGMAKLAREAIWRSLDGVKNAGRMRVKSAPAEQPLPETRLFHRPDRAVDHVAQARVVVRARHDPAVGAAAAIAETGHGNVPRVRLPSAAVNARPVAVVPVVWVMAGVEGFEPPA